MSDARQDEANGGDGTDIAIDEEEAPSASTNDVAPPPAAGTPLAAFAAPPPAAGAVGSVATPRPGVLDKTAVVPPAAAVTEPAPADAVPVPKVSVPTSAAATGDGLHVLFAGMTSVGLVREHNEDNLVIADLGARSRQATGQTIASTVTSGGAMFAVCDGMGGAAAGEVASQMAVDFLFEQMCAGQFGADRDALARHLVSVVERAGKQIFDTAQADRSRRGMGTTSTVAVLLDKVLFVAQVGDSRAYILRNGTLKQVTKDQSLVNQLIEAGHLTEEEAEAFEHSNIILQALGTSEKVQVDLTFVELRQSDRLMMCSDGLSGLVHAETIAETLRTIGEPSACCAKLTEQANEGGGHDNITVIVADFTGSALQPPQSGEVAGYNQYPLLPGGTATSGNANGANEGARPADADGETTTRGGAWQWWLMGLIAILLGVAISWWWEKKQTPPALENSAPVVAPPALPEPAATKPVEEVPEPELVPAHITTDAETGQLLIDGEPRGPLAAGAPRDLDLAPGSYRLELQIDGSVAVSQVIAVESGKPLDVTLALPTGASAAPEPAPEEEPAPTPARRARPTSAEQANDDDAPSAPTPARPAATKTSGGVSGSAAGSAPSVPVKRDLPANPF